MVENVRKTRLYDAADAKVGEGPRGMLQAGPAAEIVERNQDPRRIPWRDVQDEVGVLPHGPEQCFSQPVSRYGGHEAHWQDAVSIKHFNGQPRSKQEKTTKERRNGTRWEKVRK